MGGLVLFDSSIGFGIVLAMLFMAFILADIFENGYSAIVCVLIFIGLNYFWGNFVWLSIFTWFNVGSYLFIGFLFSLLRTYFKGKEFNKHTGLFDKDGEKNKLYDKNGNCKDGFELKDNIFRWWFLFPISALNWVFGNLLVNLWDLIYSKVNKLYELLFNGKQC